MKLRLRPSAGRRTEVALALHEMNKMNIVFV